MKLWVIHAVSRAEGADAHALSDPVVANRVADWLRGKNVAESLDALVA